MRYTELSQKRPPTLQRHLVQRGVEDLAGNKVYIERGGVDGRRLLPLLPVVAVGLNGQLLEQKVSLHLGVVVVAKDLWQS